MFAVESLHSASLAAWHRLAPLSTHYPELNLLTIGTCYLLSVREFWSTAFHWTLAQGRNRPWSTGARIAGNIQEPRNKRRTSLCMKRPVQLRSDFSNHSSGEMEEK